MPNVLRQPGAQSWNFYCESISGADSQGHSSTFPFKALLKNRLLPPLLHTLFPIMAAEPSLGQLDPEDQDSEEEELESGLVGETPKHFAVQVRCATGWGRLLGRCGAEMESSKVFLIFFRLWTCWHYICPRRSSVPCW